MSRFISITIIMTFLSVAFFITTNNSYAGHAGFRIGPDGNAYKLIDCSIPANNEDLSKCANSGPPPSDATVGVISWNTSRGKAQNMTFKGFPCDLASPSTEEINDFLKSFPGFLEACNGNGCFEATNTSFELCAWFGGLKSPPVSNKNGPFFFVKDLTEEIPCPFDSTNGPACDPIVDPGVDTPLTFQDWCRVNEQTPDCNADEPNLGTDEIDDFLTYLLIEGVVGWADCRDFACVTSRCQPTSYFVQCDVPPTVVTPIPTLSEWGLIAMVGILGIIGYMVIRRKKATA